MRGRTGRTRAVIVERGWEPDCSSTGDARVLLCGAVAVTVWGASLQVGLQVGDLPARLPAARVEWRSDFRQAGRRESPERETLRIA